MGKESVERWTRGQWIMLALFQLGIPLRNFHGERNSRREQPSLRAAPAMTRLWCEQVTVVVVMEHASGRLVDGGKKVHG